LILRELLIAMVGEIAAKIAAEPAANPSNE
jgi:hypothetical protein